MKPKEIEEPDRWLTAAEVAELTGFSKSQIWKGEGALAELTPINHISKRSVRYSRKEVLEWMDAQFKKAKALKEQQSTPPQINNVVELKPRRRQRNFKRERRLRLIALIRDRKE